MEATVAKPKRKSKGIFKCDYDNCSYETPWDFNLKTHMRTHTKEKPYKCEYEDCTDAFTTSGGLKQHLFMHINIKQFECDYEGCKFASTRAYALRIHKHTHTGDMPRPCKCDFQGCEYAATRPEHLIKHKAIVHLGEKTFKCDHIGCTHASYSLWHFDVHKRTHTGEKPYKCEEEGCDFAGPTQSSLVTHMLHHSGERPFICEECGYSTTTVSNLTSHKYKHIQDKPHKCTYGGCSFAACIPSLLENHLHIHTPEYQANRKKEETKIMKLFDANNISYKREHSITYKCIGGTGARIDFVVIINNVVLFIEVDEFQHSAYGIVCDIKRMNEVYASLLVEGNTLPLVFIRYNPHSFKINGQTTKVTDKERHTSLLNTLNIVAEMEADLKPLSVIYLFYDCDVNNCPTILSDPEYDENIKGAYLSL